MTFTDALWLSWHTFTLICNLAFIGGAICLIWPRTSKLTLRLTLIVTRWGQRRWVKWFVLGMALMDLIAFPYDLAHLLTNTHGLW